MAAYSADTLQPIDAQLMKVPFESLKRQARERKSVIEELQQVAGKVAKAADTPSTAEATTALLEELAASVSKQLEQHAAASVLEAEDAQRLDRRCHHLALLARTAPSSSIEWNRHRLPRLIVDYFLREGHFGAASALLKECQCGDLADGHMFHDAETIVESLRNKDCTLTLQWCAANSARLKRIKSKLQFRLHVQEYVELIKQDRVADALAYARAQLVPFAADELADFKQALALLVFRRRTPCARYQALLACARWRGLAGLFLEALLRINSMSAVSTLELQLQAGLTALKCPLSYEQGCTREDPLHLPVMKELAADLPGAKHVTSKLVCSVTKAIMDDSNPPMVLPNGYVYSKRAVEDLAKAHGGQVKCPVTGDECLLEECVQAFVV